MVKVACTVWRRGKEGDNIKFLPIPMLNIPITENYKARNGFYPETILADKIYRNRKSLNYCKENAISITGLTLSRHKNNKTRAKKNQEYVDTCERNC